jgi:proline dehydrogenase
MEREELANRALNYDELQELKVSLDEYDDLSEFADDQTEWYNEAVWTAAELFVQAAEESDEFCDSFVSDEKTEEEMGEDEITTIEVDAWRDVMEEEVPEYHEKVMSIGLSAFQGGKAEQVARRCIE